MLPEYSCTLHLTHKIKKLLNFLLPDQEQLEKAREIIKRLKEEKRRLAEEMNEKLKTTELSMEDEKEKLVQELSRGKAAAVTLLQVFVESIYQHCKNVLQIFV